MTNKEYVYQEDGRTVLYQESTSNKNNDNPAIIQITNSADFSISSESNAEGKSIKKLIAEIPADVFDKIAIAWCKKRKLHGALGGPVGMEFGSPDCDWD
jgi:hypothetical protein